MKTKKLSKTIKSNYKRAFRIYKYGTGIIFAVAILGGPKLYTKIDQRFDNINKILSHNIQYAASLGEEGKISRDDEREF